MQAEALNLPQKLAIKFKGQKIKLIENKKSVTLIPIDDVVDEFCGLIKLDGTRVEKFLEERRGENVYDAIDKAYGMFESDGHEVDRYMLEKQEEIALEDRNINEKDKNNLD
jgi:hypothetical protein